jgi:hypothetical protein
MAILGFDSAWKLHLDDPQWRMSQHSFPALPDPKADFGFLVQHVKLGYQYGSPASPKDTLQRLQLTKWHRLEDMHRFGVIRALVTSDACSSQLTVVVITDIVVLRGPLTTLKGPLLISSSNPIPVTRAHNNRKSHNFRGLQNALVFLVLSPQRRVMGV